MAKREDLVTIFSITSPSETCQIDHDGVVKWDMGFLPPVCVLIHLGKVLLHEFSKRDIDSHDFGEDFSILLDEDDVCIVFHCFS